MDKPPQISIPNGFVAFVGPCLSFVDFSLSFVAFVAFVAFSDPLISFPDNLSRRICCFCWSMPEFCCFFFEFCCFCCFCWFRPNRSKPWELRSSRAHKLMGSRAHRLVASWADGLTGSKGGPMEKHVVKSMKFISLPAQIIGFEPQNLVFGPPLGISPGSSKKFSS